MGHYNKSIVVMFLGVPGSGKSYFARNLADKLHAVRINGDSMRLAMFGSLEEIDRIYHSEDRRKLNEYVFNGLDYVAEQILMRGNDVVYDAHQNKRMDRKTVEQIADRHNAVPLVVRINTSHETALERTQSREIALDQRKMTLERALDAIDRHQANTDDPKEDEIVIDIDGEIAFEKQFEVFNERLLEIMDGR